VFRWRRLFMKSNGCALIYHLNGATGVPKLDARSPSERWRRLRSQANHTCSFAITGVLKHTIGPYGQSPGVNSPYLRLARSGSCAVTAFSNSKGLTSAIFYLLSTMGAVAFSPHALYRSAA
jgi:hypothetical protein